MSTTSSPFLAKPVYLETEPRRAHRGGDIGGDTQVGEAWTRRYLWLMPGGDTFAVIDESVYVSCPPGDNPGSPDPATLAMTRQIDYTVCTDPLDVGGTELYADTTYTPITWTVDRSPTEGDARAACDATDPASFDWDGAPGAFRPCVVNASQDSSGVYRGRCGQHGCVSSVGDPSVGRAWQSFVCDRGRGWRFIVDDADGAHRMTDLSGVKAAVTNAVLAEWAEGAGAPPAVVYYYRGRGIAQRIDWSQDTSGGREAPLVRLHARSYVLHEWVVQLPVDTAAARV
jgi:hypothetical protein